MSSPAKPIQPSKLTGSQSAVFDLQSQDSWLGGKGGLRLITRNTRGGTIAIGDNGEMKNFRPSRAMNGHLNKLVPLRQFTTAEEQKMLEISAEQILEAAILDKMKAFYDALPIDAEYYEVDISNGSLLFDKSSVRLLNKADTRAYKVKEKYGFAHRYQGKVSWYGDSIAYRAFFLPDEFARIQEQWSAAAIENRDTLSCYLTASHAVNKELIRIAQFLGKNAAIDVFSYVTMSGSVSLGPVRIDVTTDDESTMNIRLFYKTQLISERTDLISIQQSHLISKGEFSSYVVYYGELGCVAFEMYRDAKKAGLLKGTATSPTQPQ